MNTEQIKKLPYPQIPKIKNASELKFWHEQNYPDSHFFSRSSMKFFGDTMKNFGIQNLGTEIYLYRKRAVKHLGNKGYYFCSQTAQRLRSE